MRTMMKVTVPVEEGNRVMKDGSVNRIIQQTIEATKPEATYFYNDNGVRTALLIFDLKDSSQLPPIGEPLFRELNATVLFTPVLNLEDLQKGLANVKK
jgi:hypothetical protein